MVVALAAMAAAALVQAMVTDGWKESGIRWPGCSAAVSPTW
jgi:hypothetical protein